MFVNTTNAQTVHMICNNLNTEDSIPKITITVEKDNSASFLYYYKLPDKSIVADSKNCMLSSDLECKPGVIINRLKQIKENAEYIDYQRIKEKTDIAMERFNGVGEITLTINKKNGAAKISWWELSTTETKQNKTFQFKQDVTKEIMKISYDRSFQCK